MPRNLAALLKFHVVCSRAFLVLCRDCTLFKFGSGSNVTSRQTVEIGNESSPYGSVWILGWIDSLVTPLYKYTLSLGF